MTLGEKIRQLRKEKGLSQEEFGRRSGIHPKHVGKYEANKNIPSAEKLRVIAEVLAVSTDYLLFDNVPKTGRVEVNDPELLEKFTILDKMQERDRQTVKSILDAMILKSQVEGLVGQGLKTKRYEKAVSGK